MFRQPKEEGGGGVFPSSSAPSSSSAIGKSLCCGHTFARLVKKPPKTKRNNSMLPWAKAVPATLSGSFPPPPPLIGPAPLSQARPASGQGGGGKQKASKAFFSPTYLPLPNVGHRAWNSQFFPRKICVFPSAIFFFGLSSRFKNAAAAFPFGVSGRARRKKKSLDLPREETGLRIQGEKRDCSSEGRPPNIYSKRTP